MWGWNINEPKKKIKIQHNEEHIKIQKQGSHV
jgi:hypothetical protein